MVATVLMLLFFPGWVHAKVTVLGPQLHCEGRMSPDIQVQRSVHGLQTSLEEDPDSPVPLSREVYAYEALSSVEKVRSLYGEIFRKRGMSPEEVRERLARFAKDDVDRVGPTGAQANGIDNTFYFVVRGANGEPLSILRATVVKKGEDRQLSLEKYVRLPDSNRVELERAFNAASPWAGIHSREVMMVAAQIFNQVFEGNDYTVYGFTDRARARDYRQRYEFQETEQTEIQSPIRYLVEQAGTRFYERYIGHVQAAYHLAFQGPFNKQLALAYLEEFEQQPGMKEYVPNLVAQAVIHASMGHYDAALDISDHLSRLGKAQINDDYYVLWKSRAKYDPFTREGDAEGSLKIVREYLAAHPLVLDRYNRRALLFLVFQIKILLSIEKFEEATAIIERHRELLKVGVSNQWAIFSRHWNTISTYHYRRFNASRARLRYTELLWDLGTHEDPFAISVLQPETYDLAARECETLGRSGLAAHYRRVAQSLRRAPL